MEQYKYEVTIGMPVYGVEKYIEKALCSVLNQSFQNIEILLIDDRGKDKSIDIIKNIQIKYPRGKDIRIITHEQNMGCWAARNTILKEAQGKYLYLMDSDDYISPKCIELLHNAAVKNDSDAVFGSIEQIYEAPNIKPILYKLPNILLTKEDELVKLACEPQSPITDFIWNILFKSEFLRKTNLQFQKTKFGDDKLFCADIQPLIKKSTLLSDITYYYVIRDNSLSCFQQRNYIQLEEIKQHFENNKYLKSNCIKYKNKEFSQAKCTKVMKQVFFIVCAATKNRNIITPKLSDYELKCAMKHPFSFINILSFKKYKVTNLTFYLMGKLPAHISVLLIKIVGKQRGLIK